ncbi:hypothetical protein [Anabaena sp. CCY 9910]|uniref:PIN-like domain-containing protein n=1 Tax=Anabaena sp. CCY 9910 TaxID=3103870 RepID=UPI0039E1F614
MTQPQSITFFIDRCLGNKCIVEKLRSAGLTIEIHDEHFAKDAQDVDWLPEVGKRGWVVLTKDGKISNNCLERIAVARAEIKMFTFASQSLSGEEMAEILLKVIVKMQGFVRKHPAPFIAKIYRDGKISMWKDSETLTKELEQ